MDYFIWSMVQGNTKNEILNKEIGGVNKPSVQDYSKNFKSFKTYSNLWRESRLLQKFNCMKQEYVE